jgi:chemotaxis signal transduction protein
MADLTNQQELQYLPVELSGQLFALPMNDVTAVHRVSAGADEEPPSTDQHAASLRVLDLRYLFWKQDNSDENMYVVVVSTNAGTCALGVDRVHSARTMRTATLQQLPQLISTIGWLFNGVICESDTLMLLINSQQLVEQVQQMSPDLVLVEEAHAL